MGFRLILLQVKELLPLEQPWRSDSIKKHKKVVGSVNNVGSVVEWLKPRAYNEHGLGSKPTRAILLCPWERHFTAHSPVWWSWQVVLNYSHIYVY